MQQAHIYRARAIPSTPAAPATPIAIAVWAGAALSVVEPEAEAEEPEGEEDADEEDEASVEEAEAEEGLPDELDEGAADPEDDPVTLVMPEVALTGMTTPPDTLLLIWLWMLEGMLVNQSGNLPVTASENTDSA